MADGSAAEIRWFTTAQLVGLPDLPSTERGIRKKAEIEGWESRPRAVGKGREYPETALPELARRELQRRAAISAANTSSALAEGAALGRKLALKESIDKAVQQRQREAGAARAAGLTGKSRARMEARLDLLARFDTFEQFHGLGVCAAFDAFCAAIQAGEIALSADAQAVIGEAVSPATLRRWKAVLQTQGAAALAGDYGNRSGTGLIDAQPELRDFFLGVLTDKPHLGSKNLHRAICARFSHTSLKLPTVRTVARYLETFKLKHPQLYTAIANPDAWKNKFMSAFGSASEDVTRLNQRWEFDSTPADIMLTDGRHTIVQVVDIWSRRRVFFVAKTSSSSAVCQAVRRAVIAWGIPEQAKIDNGQDYVAERTQRGLRSLGVETLISPPFQPWKKPHVESGFRVLLHGIFELLPGYIGHDVADQQAIRSRKSFAERLFKKNEVVEIRMSAADLQSFLDRWCESDYQHEAQDALGKLTPFQRAASWTGEIRRITDERVLDLLLAEAPDGNGGRTVKKKGISVDRLTYIAPELHGLVGERVQVLYDERDVGRIVVYHNGEFCCVAECPEVLGVSRAEIAAEANRQRKEGIAAQRAEMRRLARKANTTDLAFEHLARKERENAALAALPLADNVVHITPAIEAAQDAAAALDVPSAPAFDGVKELREQIAIRDVVRAEQQQDETSEQRFMQMLDILLKDPAERNDLDRHRLKTYFDSSEFQGRWTMLQGFGPEALGLDPKYDALLEGGAFAHRFREAQLKGSF